MNEAFLTSYIAYKNREKNERAGALGQSKGHVLQVKM